MKDPWRRIRGWGSRSELEPLAVIDIGSNSVRMVVYEGAIRSPQPIYNEKVLCGLGRNVGSTGALGEEPTRRALTALARFGVITRLMKVKNVRAIATAAVREAADGPDFIAAGERACGAKIEILSGAKEAELAAAGVAMGFMMPDGIAGDLGGGSLELIDIGPTGQAHHDASLPLGGLRLYDSAQGRLETGAKLAAKALARVGWLKADRARPFYAVGGTWRAFAKLYMAEVDYPLHV
ncbi:MAG: exopolyphosphatase, partial [Pseudomonadota bacterium]